MSANEESVASKVSGSLRNVLWKHKYLTKEVKSRIFKACLLPVIIYTSETRPNPKRHNKGRLNYRNENVAMNEKKKTGMEPTWQPNGQRSITKIAETESRYKQFALPLNQ
ncbi:hypothetical protein WA026_007109 [Henosepilachna vigintioctopunctata]|uniref:Uncharacterized protein n=1 Tax=Henosepilachna vigintioctopunctata TaxID=420089 RepID=A0AAW1VBK8_9CUCU